MTSAKRERRISRPARVKASGWRWPETMALILVLVFGPIVLGVSAALGDTIVLDDASNFLAIMFAGATNSSAGWTTLAFVVGALNRRIVIAVAAGVATLVAAIFIYYATIDAFDIREGVDFASLAAAREVWIFAAFPAGIVFGVAGHTWRTADWALRGVAVGVLLAAFLGDALLLEFAGYRLGWAAAGLVAAVLLTRRPAPFGIALLTGVALAGVAATIFAYVIDIAGHAHL